MSKTRLAIALALTLVAPLAPPAAALEDPAEKVVVSELDNGLVVLTLEDATTPIVSFQMWVKVGSRDESAYSGLAHLFEHMMFNGSRNIGPEEHARLINARGGRVNAYTTNDFTVFFEDVTTESLPLVIDLEHERVANLDIGEEALQRERKVVLEERSLRTEDQPMGRAYEMLSAITWIAHPYRRPVIGWRSDVEKATAEVCRRFFDTFYVPNNMVIAIVGAFDTEQALDHLRRTFGTLPRSPLIPRNPTEEPAQEGERRADVYFDLSGPILAAAWHAPATGSEDGEALDVLSEILSNGRSSRLYRHLVHEAEIALSAQGGYWELLDGGAFLAIAGVRPGEDIDEVERLFFAEIERTKREPVSEQEIEKAKRQLEVQLVNGLATNHALASRIGRDYATFGRVRPLEERLERIRRVTAADVLRVARTYLLDETRNVVHVIPKPAKGPEPGSSGARSAASSAGGGA